MHLNLIEGLWGVKLDKIDGNDVRKAAKTLFKSNHEHVYDFDQKILEKIVWPLAATDVVDNFTKQYAFISIHLWCILKYEIIKFLDGSRQLLL